jgi:hypothetical protein
VSCLAGTGDFRLFVGDSKTDGAGWVKTSGFAKDSSYGGIAKQLAKPPFNKYRGYHFRIYPHVSEKAHSYHDSKTGHHVPCGFYLKVRPAFLLHRPSHRPSYLPRHAHRRPKSVCCQHARPIYNSHPACAAQGRVSQHPQRPSQILRQRARVVKVSWLSTELRRD